MTAVRADHILFAHADHGHECRRSICIRCAAAGDIDAALKRKSGDESSLVLALVLFTSAEADEIAMKYPDDSLCADRALGLGFRSRCDSCVHPQLDTTELRQGPKSFTWMYCFFGERMTLDRHVTALFLFVTRYKLLFDDWRGYLIAAAESRERAETTNAGNDQVDTQ